MPRPLRIEYEGAIYHVTVRGNGRQKLFLSDADRGALCRRLKESVKSYGVRLYLYCLMDTHFHLVVETPRANLQRFMQSVLTSYTAGFNSRHRRCGHVTQGRYGARLVAGNDYLLKLSRYVHLNPVHVKGWEDRTLAERVAELREHRWSSYRAYVGLDAQEEWVSYGPMLGLVVGEASRVGRHYERFVEAGLTQPDEAFLDEMERSPRGIGDDRFREWVEERHQALLKTVDRPEDVAFRPAGGRVAPETVLNVIAKLWGVKPSELAKRRPGWPGKGVAAWMLEKYAGLTRRAIGPKLGIGSGTGVAYQIRQATEQTRSDRRLERLVADAERQLGREGAHERIFDYQV